MPVRSDMSAGRAAALGAAVTILVLAVAWSSSAHASGFSKVGNGDSGSDLEGAVPLTSGPIVDARAKAVELLQRLGTPGIRGLGLLLPEVQGSGLYLAREDRTSSLPQDQGAFHGDMTGRVYARTLAVPHAATRFFPVAEKLTEKELIALHIHEGLHRALPPTIREDESIVSQITVAIVGPEATRDQIEQVMARVVPETDLRVAPPPGSGPAAPAVTPHAAVPEAFAQPSSVGYLVRHYFPGKQPPIYAIRRLHVVHSDLYPFGGPTTPFGMGIEGAFVESDHGPRMGPLGLSARFRVLSRKSFDLGFWGTASLNTLSNEELKQSPFGRDVFAVGMSMRKALQRLYVENTVGLSLPGSSEHSFGLVNYRYKYGSILNVRVRAGMRTGGLDAGGFVELHLADYFRVEGGAEGFDSGRYRILSAGPEVSYRWDTVSVSVFGRALVNATRAANFDYLGNLMGTGLGQGSLGASVSVFF